jgi:PadR family transcriptional regulator PadR
MYKEVKMKISKELVKGSTSILILSLLEKEDMYGYQISQKLKTDSENVFEMKEGTLYPMLHALENDNAISSYWLDAENGKKRKYYQITKEGKKLLSDKKKEWNVYTKAVNSIIGGACYVQ